MRRVLLIRERIDLGEELAGLQDVTNVADLEHGLVGVARSFSERRGISYAAWRETGVGAAVSKPAGITRSMCPGTMPGPGHHVASRWERRFSR